MVQASEGQQLLRLAAKSVKTVLQKKTQGQQEFGVSTPLWLTKYLGIFGPSSYQKSLPLYLVEGYLSSIS
jgi:hypothetical protein